MCSTEVSLIRPRQDGHDKALQVAVIALVSRLSLQYFARLTCKESDLSASWEGAGSAARKAPSAMADHPSVISSSEVICDEDLIKEAESYAKCASFKRTIFPHHRAYNYAVYGMLHSFQRFMNMGYMVLAYN